MNKNILFIAIIFFLVSCNRKHGDADKTSFRYNEANGIATLDPAFAKDQSITWPCLQIYNGLVQLDSALKIKPCIASSWEISDSGKTFLFHLRNDVWFHKNYLFGKDSTRRVIASDFIYSFNRLADPQLASPGSWVLSAVGKNLHGEPIGVEAKNDSTLVIHLSKSYPPFLSLLTMPYCSVVPHEVTSHYGIDFRNNPCGTGPFKFSYWKEGVKLILLKNENYFETENGKKLPLLDAVEISFITDKQSAFIEFLKGNLDFISGLDAGYKDELLTRQGNLQSKYRGKFIMETQPYLNTEYLGILMDDKNTSNPLLNKKIRQALSYSIDRKKMIAYLKNNIGTAGDYGFVPPGIPSFDTTLKAYPFDRQRARDLMKEAGFPNGKGLPEITLSTTTNYQDLTEFIKSQWEECGFSVRVDVNQAAVHRKMIAEQKLSFFRGSWIADYPDAETYMSLFYSKNFAPAGPNYTHFYNEQFDHLFENAMAESNDSLRAIDYVAMDQLVMENAPVIILYYDKVLRLHANNVYGLKSNAMNLLILKNVRKGN